MDFRHLLEQAQNFQRNLAEIEKAMGALRVGGSSGGGAARVVVNGQGEVLELSVEQPLIAGGDARLVAQTVLAAIRQAQQKARAERDHQRGRLLSGLDIPDL